MWLVFPAAHVPMPLGSVDFPPPFNHVLSMVMQAKPWSGPWCIPTVPLSRAEECLLRIHKTLIPTHGEYNLFKLWASLGQFLHGQCAGLEGGRETLY